MNLAFENSVFTGKLLCIFIREFNIYIKFLIDLMAAYLIFKTGNKGTGTKLKRIIFTFSAVKCLSVYKTFKIKGNRITCLCGSVIRNNKAGISLLQALEFIIYVLVCSLCIPQDPEY